MRINRGNNAVSIGGAEAINFERNMAALAAGLINCPSNPFFLVNLILLEIRKPLTIDTKAFVSIA